MAHISTGTQEAHGEHSTGTALLGAAISYAIPAAIAIAGIAHFGWNAIAWPNALVWGAVAALAFLLVARIGGAYGMTKMDLLDLLGSMFTPPHTSASRTFGFIIHLVNGALLGVTYAYALLLTNLQAGWPTGLLWGVILWALAMIMLSSIGGVHPAIRNHSEEDPGPAGTNFGKLTPMGTFIAHCIYGIVLGLLYRHLDLR